jgi:hypothetical protein
MADEIRMSVSLQVAIDGAAIATGSLSTTMDMVGEDVGTVTQNIGTSNEALDIPVDVTGDVVLVVKNLSPESVSPAAPGDEYVEIFKDSGNSHLMSKLWPGDVAMLGRVPHNALYGKSTGATQKIQLWVTEV